MRKITICASLGVALSVPVLADEQRSDDYQQTIWSCDRVARESMISINELHPETRTIQLYTVYMIIHNNCMDEFAVDSDHEKHPENPTGVDDPVLPSTGNPKNQIW